MTLSLDTFEIFSKRGGVELNVDIVHTYFFDGFPKRCVATKSWVGKDSA